LPRICSYELPPASAGGCDFPVEALAEMVKGVSILRALAEALRNCSIFVFRLKPVQTLLYLRLKPEAIHKAEEVEANKKGCLSGSLISFVTSLFRYISLSSMSKFA
jgi:hypothetical protein